MKEARDEVLRKQVRARDQPVSASVIGRLSPWTLRAAAMGSQTWEHGWWFSLPLVADMRRFALTNGTSIRTAVGVITDPRPLGPNYSITDGGLVWIEGTDISGLALPGAVRRTCDNSGWVRWARAEHAARLASFSSTWCIDRIEDRWFVNGRVACTLLDALEAVGYQGSAVTFTQAPEPRRTSWPVSATAFSMAADRSANKGLARLCGQAGSFECYYPDSRARGIALLDALGHGRT